MPESLVLALIKGKVGGSRWHLEEPFVPVWYEVGLHEKQSRFLRLVRLG